MTGAELISEFLAVMDLPSVFGVSGANCEDLFESIGRKAKSRIFLSKSEYGAATMALGQYLASLKTGVVVTTSGPGILNTIPVLAEAFTSKLPLLVLAGSVPLDAEGEGPFQDTSGKSDSIDLEAMLKQCTCFVRKITSEEMFADTLQTAYLKCLQDKRPAVVIVPKDMAQGEIFTRRDFVHPEKADSDETLLKDQLQNFCNEMSRGKTQPLIVLGDDCVHVKEKKNFLDFAERCDAQVIVTPNAKGCFDHQSKRFAGLIGIMGHESALKIFQAAAHVLFIGFHKSSLNLIGINEAFVEKKKFFLDADQSQLLIAMKSPASKKIEGSTPALPSNYRKGFYPETIVSVIQKTLSKDANIFVDAGNTGAWVVHHFKCSGQGLFSISLGMGGMGNSIGAAIGAASLRQKRSVVFMGDGSFLLQGLEIHTALQYSLPVTVFIFNNNAHQMCSTRERLFLKAETNLNRFKPSFFANGILKMFPGLPAREIYSIEDLEECLSDFKSVRGPVVISLNCNETDNPPFLTFKRSQV